MKKFILEYIKKNQEENDIAVLDNMLLNIIDGYGYYSYDAMLLNCEELILNYIETGEFPRINIYCFSFYDGYDVRKFLDDFTDKVFKTLDNMSFSSKYEDVEKIISDNTRIFPYIKTDNKHFIKRCFARNIMDSSITVSSSRFRCYFNPYSLRSLMALKEELVFTEDSLKIRLNNNIFNIENKKNILLFNQDITMSISCKGEYSYFTVIFRKLNFTNYASKIADFFSKSVPEVKEYFLSNINDAFKLSKLVIGTFHMLLLRMVEIRDNIDYLRNMIISKYGNNLGTILCYIYSFNCKFMNFKDSVFSLDLETMHFFEVGISANFLAVDNFCKYFFNIAKFWEDESFDPDTCNIENFSRNYTVPYESAAVSITNLINNDYVNTRMVFDGETAILNFVPNVNTRLLLKHVIMKKNDFVPEIDTYDIVKYAEQIAQYNENNLYLRVCMDSLRSIITDN